jgi:hypothetical protein
VAVRLLAINSHVIDEARRRSFEPLAASAREQNGVNLSIDRVLHRRFWVAIRKVLAGLALQFPF